MAVRTISKKVLECTCERETCKHVWEATTKIPPLICPKCKSAGWNRKKPGDRDEAQEPARDATKKEF